MSTCVFEKKSWWNISNLEKQKQRLFVLGRLEHQTPSVLQGELCRLSFKPDQTEVIHICIMNKHEATDAKKIHVLTSTLFLVPYAGK